MCGIIGIINNKLPLGVIKSFMEQGLMVNSLRGEDSTGTFCVTKNGVTSIYKKIMAGWDFVQLNGTERIFNRENIRFIVGHNRSTTRGSSSDIAHAHPVVQDNIVLVHNGTLSNVYELNSDVEYKLRPIHDSTAIALRLSLDKDPTLALEKLDGSYALAWYDSSTGLFHLARNSERPLFLGQEKEGNGLLFASEPLMLRWLAERNNITLKNGTQELKAGTLITIPLQDNQLIKTKFNIYTRKVYNHGNYQQNNNLPIVYGYATTFVGDTFRATYVGKYIDSLDKKQFLKFKREGDTNWAWVVPEDVAIADGNASGILNPKYPMVEGSMFMLKAVESRLGENNCANKKAQIIAPVSTVHIINNKKEHTADDIIKNFKINQMVEFMVETVRTNNNKNSAYVEGITHDNHEAIVKLYQVDAFTVKEGVFYKSKIQNIITASRVGPYLLLSKDELKEIGKEHIYCAWCTIGLTDTEARQNVRPEIGPGSVLCDDCAETIDYRDPEYRGE